MKPSISTLLALVCTFAITTASAQVNNAQPATANPSGTIQSVAPAKHGENNKGHFIFGTNLFNYETASYHQSDFQNGTLNSTYTANFSTASVSLNVWAGYFVSDKFALGLSYNGIAGNIYEYGYAGSYYDYFGYLPLFSPSNLFFRCYILSGDSTPVDIFLEGLIGGNYSSNSTGTISETYPGGGSSSTPNQPPVNVLSFSGNVNLVFSINASTHFAFQVRLGLVYNYIDITEAAYASQGITYQSGEAKINSPAFQGTFGLQYKL